MIKKFYVVAIITARGGSKGVPKKNIVTLAGKPLIAYTIDAAKKSKYLDRVIVSTDDQEIARISRKYGAEVPFMRPDFLSGDSAQTSPVVKHAVQFLEQEGRKIDLVVTLQPTSPFRTSVHIDQAIELLVNSNLNGVVGVKQTDLKPYWMVTVCKGEIRPIVDDGVNYFKKQRQELPKSYVINGAIYVTKKEILFKKHEIIPMNKCGAFIMDDKTSMDIDTKEDLRLIRQVMRKSIKG